MVERGVIMKHMAFCKLKCNILFRKYLINLLLLFFSPTNKFMVILSQDLDKYIVLYQKKLFFTYSIKNKISNSINDMVA